MRSTRQFHSHFSAPGPALLRRARGYSLHDALVTLAVVGTTTMSVAGLQGVVQDHRRTAIVNDLVATLSLARSAAITRGAETVLCPSLDNQNCGSASGGQTLWHEGAMLFVDENDDGLRNPNEPVIRAYLPDARNVRIKSSPFRARVVFQPSGLSPGTTVTFTVCAGAKTAKYIILSNSGRARVSALPADELIDETHEMCP